MVVGHSGALTIPPMMNLPRQQLSDQRRLERRSWRLLSRLEEWLDGQEGVPSVLKRAPGDVDRLLQTSDNDLIRQMPLSPDRVGVPRRADKAKSVCAYFSPKRNRSPLNCRLDEIDKIKDM